MLTQQAANMCAAYMHMHMHMHKPEDFTLLEVEVHLNAAALIITISGQVEERISVPIKTAGASTSKHSCR